MQPRIFVALVMTLSFAPAAIAADKPMTGAQLTALLAAGKALQLGGKGTGYSGNLVLKSDGTGDGKAAADDGKWSLEIKGTWKIKGDQFCRVWQAGRDAGKEVCESWVPDGSNRVKVIVGGKSIGINAW